MSNITFETISFLVVIPGICVFGILGNVLTLVVLIRGRIRGIAYSYLKAVAVLDLLSLVFIFPIFSQCSNCPIHNTTFSVVFEAYFFIFVGDVFIKASVWTVIVFTVERCFTICFPSSVFKAWTNNQRNSALISVLIVCAVVIVENLPTFWYHEITEDGRVVRTYVSEHSLFFVIYRWFDAIFAYVVPFIVLFVFNVILVRFIIKRNDRKNMIRSTGTLAKTRQFREQTRVLFTLIGVLLLFFLSMLPCFVLQLMAQYAIFESDVFVTFRVLVTILVSINCSGNFILYCLLNRRFWTVFKKTFGCCCCSSSSQTHPEFITSHTENRSRVNFAPRIDGFSITPGEFPAPQPSASLTGQIFRDTSNSSCSSITKTNVNQWHLPRGRQNLSSVGSISQTLPEQSLDWSTNGPSPTLNSNSNLQALPEQLLRVPDIKTVRIGTPDPNNLPLPTCGVVNAGDPKEMPAVEKPKRRTFLSVTESTSGSRSVSSTGSEHDQAFGEESMSSTSTFKCKNGNAILHHTITKRQLEGPGRRRLSFVASSG